MTHQLLPRSAWTTVPRPTSKLTAQRSPRGFAVHWPGTTLEHLSTNPNAIARLLEAERRDHVTDRGWADIAYQAAVDNSGRIWDCRGWAYRPAANGDQDVNASHGAITCLLGRQDAPSAAMIDAVRWWRVTHWLTSHPGAIAVVGHKDLHATDCPGPALYGLVRAHTFTAAPSPAPGHPPAAPPRFPLKAGQYFGPPERGPGAIGRGPGLKTWQKRMAERGWTIKADGIYGDQTAGVAHAFQLEKHLAADSLIGRQTWEAAWTLPVT